MVFFSETQQMFCHFNDSRCSFIYLNFITQFFPNLYKYLAPCVLKHRHFFGDGDFFLLLSFWFKAI